MQQTIIDALDKGEYVKVTGSGENQTDLKVMLHPLADPAKETIFENCVADVNIPVGEVFTSPVSGRNRTGFPSCESRYYLHGLSVLQRSGRSRFQNGMVAEYTAARTLIHELKRIKEYYFR